jgi:SNF2 family DNA or RNA helicase
MIRSRREPKLDSKLEAFVFQQSAVEAVKGFVFSAVFHEQGLGKTKIGLDIILYWLRSGVVDSALIVTKRSLVANWCSEIKTHTHIIPRILDQDRAANYFAFNSPSRIYLTHYEVVAGEEKRLQLFLKTRRVGVMLDEAQKIKNPDSALSRAFHRLGPLFPRRMIMTGTPVANRPYDVWSQIFFLDAGKALGDSFEDFRSRLDLSNDLYKSADRQQAYEKSLLDVNNRLRHFTVRETKKSSGIELPGKNIQNICCDLEERQHEIYIQYKEQLSAHIINAGLPKNDKAEDILKRLLRLVQVASNPLLVDESYKREPGKWPVLERLVDAIIDKKEKAIVWTSFKGNAEWLRRRLSSYGCVMIHGDVAIEERNRRLTKFKSDTETRILVATPGSAKEGLTLTVANHAIFFDRSFSLDDYLQAQDRIHRISQTKTCYIYNLVAEGTIDEWIDMLIDAKSMSAQLVQGDISGPEYASKMSYSFGEIIKQVLNLQSDEDYGG